MPQSCPGYASYTILGDGSVQVNGSVPIFSDETSQQRLLDAWDEFGDVITEVAWKYGIPAPWMLGILMQESGGGDPSMVCSPCTGSCCSEAGGRKCCAFGIMQFTAQTAASFGTSAAALLADDGLAIERAGAFIASIFTKRGGDFVKIAVEYNAGPGGLSRCNGGDEIFGYGTNPNYAYRVVRWSNTAIALGLKTFPSRTAGFLTGLLGAAALAAGAIYAMQKGWLPFKPPFKLPF